MRRLSILLAFAWLLPAGCGSAGPEGALEAGKPGDAKIAGGGGKHKPYDAPPHKFEPRSHRSHRHPAAPAPDIGSLPGLRLDLARCYGIYPEKDSAQIATPSPKPSPPPTGKKPKKSSKGKAGGSKKPASKKSSGAAGGGSVGDLLGTTAGAPAAQPAPGGGGGAFASPPPPAQPPATAPAGPPPSYSPAPAADMAAEAPAMELAGEEEEAKSEIAGDYDDESQVAAEDEEEFSEYEDWGAEIYLSNDDTMSLSSAQRVIYAIDHFLPLPLEHIRPHELLNYFSFETQGVDADDDFSVLADIAGDPRQEGIYTLGLSVRGRPVDRQSRRNAVVTLVIDRSGSMSDEGRMEYLKRGLKRMVGELKTGDMVHMVLFDHEVCVPLENYVVGRDARGDLERAIDALEPRGSTDLHRGLSRGYELADTTYQAEYTNRVLLITDALANTGVTDERMISMISKYYDKRRIRLSGVGVGREFNDALLDRLTERGKGAYVFLGSEAEVDAVFGPRFISLLETTALDVHFLLHLPESLRMNVFYGEESSTVKEDVQAIHYFANTSQLFLSDLMARGGVLRPQDDVMLTIEYEDPESGEEQYEEYAWNLGEIESEAYNVAKGRLIMAWVDMLAEMAARPVPAMYGYAEGSWARAGRCATTVAGSSSDWPRGSVVTASPRACSTCGTSTARATSDRATRSNARSCPPAVVGPAPSLTTIPAEPRSPPRGASP